jgi:hypothetical protein
VTFAFVIFHRKLRYNFLARVTLVLNHFYHLPLFLCSMATLHASEASARGAEDRISGDDTAQKVLEPAHILIVDIPNLHSRVWIRIRLASTSSIRHPLSHKSFQI